MVVAEFGFLSAAEAFASMSLPVTFCVPACANALPAKLRCSADALELPRIRPAADEILPPVPLLAMIFSKLSLKRTTSRNKKSKSTIGGVNCYFKHFLRDGQFVPKFLKKCQEKFPQNEPNLRPFYLP